MSLGVYFILVIIMCSWEIDGETVETVRDVIFGGPKITADGESSHEIKRGLLLGRKKYDQPRYYLDIT